MYLNSILFNIKELYLFCLRLLCSAFLHGRVGVQFEHRLDILQRVLLHRHSCTCRTSRFEGSLGKHASTVRGKRAGTVRRKYTSTVRQTELNYTLISSAWRILWRSALAMMGRGMLKPFLDSEEKTVSRALKAEAVQMTNRPTWPPGARFNKFNLSTGRRVTPGMFRNARVRPTNFLKFDIEIVAYRHLEHR